DSNARARALIDTAWAFALLGHIGQADEAATEGKVLGGEAVTSDPPSSERLAAIAMRLGNTQEAIPIYQRAESLYRARGDEAAATRCAVHAAYLTWRESGDGAQLSRMRTRVGSVDDPEAAMLLWLYDSERALQRSDYALCESNAIKAVKLADLRNVRRSAKIARVMAARCGRRNGNLETAARMATEAGAIVEEELSQVVGDVPRQELGFEAFLIYRLLFSLQVASGDEAQRLQQAFVTSERARARAHLDAVARNELGNIASSLPVSPALQRDTALAEERVKNLTKTLLHSRNREGVAERHRDALWALEDIKQTKLRQNPLLSRLASPRVADLATTQKRLLDGDTLLLSYFMTEDRPYVFAISRDDAVLQPLELTASELDARVRRFRQKFLLRPGMDPDVYAREATKMHEALLGPIAGRLGQHARLLIVPHGALSLVPFESLVGPDGKFVIESHEVSYGLSSSLSLALASRARKREHKLAFVGVGDPVYDWKAFAAGRKEGNSLVASRALQLWTEAAVQEKKKGKKAAPRGLPRLPGTAREVRAIAKLFGRSQKTMLRAKASEGAIKRGALAGARIVHIASHGLMAPHYQALALSLNPRDPEDGFLMNSEISELKLDADLVVLSACETGSVRFRSAEPVSGLALSLRSAGAEKVMLSLWSVDDSATAQLMIDFYRPVAGS
ncbi:MAG: CHAT domain-containing protein, partial [Erythrobacter sp.]|nr:CHAT domain-containing protein [Erythrobacter sp.]